VDHVLVFGAGSLENKRRRRFDESPFCVSPALFLAAKWRSFPNSHCKSLNLRTREAENDPLVQDQVVTFFAIDVIVSL